MYIDETIKFSDRLPKRLIDDIEQAKKYYRENNELEFDILADGIEVTTKAWYLNGRITYQDFLDVYRFFGWR